jgi:hypothetical protein
MRTQGVSVAVLLGLWAVSPARAGVYFPADPTPWPLPTIPRHFQDVLGERKNVRVPKDQAKPGPLHERVEELVKRLESKGPNLTVEERINLSACYILLQKPGDAIKLLENPRAHEEQRKNPNFMVQANLATAYHAIGEYTRALELQLDLLSPTTWPRRYEGFTTEQLRWYRRAEEAYRDLLRSRGREAAQRVREVRLDPLFPKVQDLGKEENYKARMIDPEIAKELPPDALELVKQLLLWQPFDQRLFWLYAELENARGQAEVAAQALNQLIDSGFASSEARAHRTVLLEATRQIPEEPPPWAPDWRSVLIGLGSGVLVGVLLVLQLRLLFRRSPAGEARSPPQFTSRV